MQIFRRERFLPIATVQVQDAQSFSRSPQQDAKDRGHRSFMNALGGGQLRIVAHAATEDRLPLGEGAVGNALAEGMAALGLAPTSGQGPQTQLAAGTVRQNDGAALCVQGTNGVVQDRMQ